MKYYDRNRTPIKHDKWEELSADESYRIVRKYENDKLRALVIWHGRHDGIGAKLVPDQHQRIFELRVENILQPDYEQGRAYVKYVRDDEASGFFRTEQEAINNYENFLVQYAGCEWLPGVNGNQVFVDHGNIHKPKSPDEPTWTPEVDKELIGSW